MSEAQDAALPVLQLDVISDVICPWCYIGKRKLDAALAEVTDFRLNLMWRPFNSTRRPHPRAMTATSR